ncbi:MAG: hypothetical protein ACR2GY_05310 [Phycisphaerales bacterium]
MSEPFDPIDHLADLFLTDGARAQRDNDHEEGSAPRPAACIELIVVGHLPVRAGLWLTQYADDVAREVGPTGLVRLDGGQWILEILRGREAAVRASAAASLREAMSAVADAVDHWIIRPEAATSFADALAAGPDVITILSGADEAAVVAAYRLIKDMSEAATECNHALPRIELAILGADPEQAARAHDKVATTARNHLGIDVPMQRIIRAMGALGSTLHFRFQSDGRACLRELFSEIRTGQTTDAVAEPADATSATDAIYNLEPAANHGLESDARTLENDISSDGDDAMVDELERLMAERAEVLRNMATPLERCSSSPVSTVRSNPTVPPPFAPAASTSASPHAAAVAEAPARRMPPKPAMQVEAKHVSSHRPAEHSPADAAAAVARSPQGRSLCSWITGLAQLPVECSEAETIEIAVDSSGELHLIAWQDDLRAISRAESWLQKNRKLLAMACPNHPIRPQGNVRVHVVCSEPASIADLHGTQMRLHVLAPVEVEGKTAWYAAALNA